MHITDDPEERIAIICEGCKVSEAEALKMMSRKDFSEDVARLRQLAALQRAKKNHRKFTGE